LTKPAMQHDPMDHLADALVEDILATPAEVLFAESTEDHGDARALAAELDRIVTANAWPVGALEVAVTAPGAPGAPAPDASQRSVAPAGTPGWRVGLERLRQNLLAPGGGRRTPWGPPIAAVSLLALVALSAVAALHWENRAGPGEELMRGRSPATTRPEAERTRGISHRGGEYLVLLPAQPSLEAALASYRNLQERFPALLGGRDPVIRGGTEGDHVYVAGIGPFITGDEAKNLCNKLKGAGAACDVGEAAR